MSHRYTSGKPSKRHTLSLKQFATGGQSRATLLLCVLHHETSVSNPISGSIFTIALLGVPVQRLAIFGGTSIDCHALLLVNILTSSNS